MGGSKGLVGLLSFLIFISSASAFSAERFMATRANEFALSLYHWNIQYVSGSTRTENGIVIESFEPILDLYAKHPNWKTTFEMQGYMVEVLAERYPAVLAKLKTLVDRGQIELVSCHYSDQIVLAYPRVDEEKSLAINDEVFKKHDLALSPVVFLQEDEFGEGVARLMKKHGRTAAVIMHGWDQFRQEGPAPFYSYEGLDVVMVHGNGESPAWVFVGDAELAGTGKLNNPYFYHIGWDALFRKSQKSLDRLETTMTNWETNHQIATIGEYLSTLKAKGATGLAAGPILDKMRSDFTDNVWLWMGDNRNPFSEDDDKVRSRNYASRNWLLAAETVVNEVRRRGSEMAADFDARIRDLWRLQLMAEVSDSTGLGFPFPIEVKTSLEQSDQVEQRSQALIDEVKKLWGSAALRIDTKTGVVTELPSADVSTNEGKKIERGPVGFHLGGGAHQRVAWKQLGENLWEVTVDFWPVVPRIPFYNMNILKVAFERYEDKVIYSPALLEDELKTYAFNQFTFKDMWLPLSNGLIGLGNDFYVIKNTSNAHIAARINKKKPWISFEVRNPKLRHYQWQFTVFKGSEQEALDQANRLNVYPTIIR
ncbi:hypothetical protein K2X30_10995 [bacterium]|nr:hypothetical protein [bacterium]